MLSQQELQKLAALLNHLHQCMGVKFGLMNEAAIEIYTASDQAEFCAQIQRAPGGLARCMACDRAALCELQVTQKQKKYRCHCGLTEVAMPVVETGCVIAYILFGQFLDSGDRREQWAQTRALISWHPDADELAGPFARLRQVSGRQLFSLTEIIHACISEVRMQGLLAVSEQSDATRLQSLISEHYASQLTLGRLCEMMHMGKSKLCALCREELGCTVGQLILKTRMRAARELLATTDYPLETVARMVGFQDANYFSKCFRQYAGQTPSSVRK